MTETSASGDAPRVRRWSLQTRLITAVVSLVALILVSIGLATGTILGTIIQQNLDGQVREAADRVRITTTGTAAEALSVGRQQPGTLLVLQTLVDVTGAYVADDESIVTLDDAEIDRIATAFEDQRDGTVTLPGLGEYRVLMRSDGSGLYAVVGLPTTDVTATIAQILTTVTLLTAGGLLLLSAAIALIIRSSLRPLRAVAETATRVAMKPLSEGEVSISERVPADQADERTEIGQVGAALNMLLDHVGTSLMARERNERRMRAFVADASHELRTPLASIRGYSELSLRALHQAPTAPETAANTEQALERIQAQSLRMTALVEDLLLLARLDEGQELVFGSVDLTRLAVEAVGDARVAGPDHSWRLEVDAEPIVIAGDAGRLHQVAANLLANARVHTPAGTTVTTSVAREGDSAVLRVHDDGPGVDPRVADELFERFARGDRSRARRTGGTGLGLAIARAIVQAHHGELTVRSRPGDTVFEVRLPVAGTASAAGGGPDSPEPGAEEQG
ncbi:HAMP domain-containing histidine kinase [Microbacterium sp. zg.Y1090]|uniref:sensor histidine kinase n=1 Tax=Microbacterium TaxID=33882 RepID=UPI00214BAC5D|nr:MULTISPECIES: HAMP domain-containing histidine kinase [unclassified Microbacterium]MCR2812204.1 HAMP domain-containing histidine kinase [Microbacterium sp. zg.Y1084]MCR2818358.1 HAMP domain-containing histidine kinase [Microbacterium sp. zg.Y1090]MDL5486170.1 HAMP domain-containing histidine kinase [Microbacterium sp. zg-Y1211]WIM29377.1 HAMP domain-containing histidine kinase [Microbacterium sp. zg-Y1090]